MKCRYCGQIDEDGSGVCDRCHAKYGRRTTMNNVRERVKDAFVTLRRQGYLCRANFLCCQTCGGYSLAERVDKMPPEKARKVKGVIYWHNQDEQRFKEDGTLTIAYGSVSTKKYGEIGLPTNEVGEALVEQLQKRDLIVDWDGNPSKRITITGIKETR